MNEIEQLPFGGEIIINKPVNLPLTTHEDYLGDKTFPYELYGLATLVSHKNPEEVHRYFKHDDLRRFVLENKLMSARTFNRQLKVLKETNELCTMIINEDKSISYKIFYNRDGKWFKVINSKTLEKLLLATRETVLRTYLNLLIYCDHGEFRQVESSFILGKIGLSKESRKTLRVYYDVLEDFGLIETQMRQVSSADKYGRAVVTRKTYIRLKEQNI